MAMRFPDGLSDLLHFLTAVQKNRVMEHHHSRIRSVRFGKSLRRLKALRRATDVQGTKAGVHGDISMA